ncbi:MAG: hypothetical protein HW405_576 [Candidatus Berkelbacteria bacterium]|nr:hypothetical protein [Candidatus Berkelbacteria bacterium]
MSQREYALSGVDYTKLQGFKDMMAAAGQRTLDFPNKRGWFIKRTPHSHGGIYMYNGRDTLPYYLCNTQEGLGNKNWIAEWMYQFSGIDSTFYDGIGIDTARMAVNDLIAQGALPIVYTDEVAGGDSDWFTDQRRSGDLAESFFQACKDAGMALVAGESPALKYLIKAEPPVKSAPSFSGCVTGVIQPHSRIITGEKLRVGDKILGVTSSGIHANGISLVIKRALILPDVFMTRLPNGNTLGEEALIPTMSYVALVEALLEARIDIHALLPGTGDGVAKLSFDKRPYSYRVTNWLPDERIPILFRFLRELGVSLMDCLTTFNWGIGYYIFIPASEVDRTIEIGTKAGYEIMEVGQIEEGQRQTIFGPAGDLVLPPPGE